MAKTEKKKLKYNADVKCIKRAIDGIGNGFSWIDTPQGIDYWNEVSENLDMLLAEVTPIVRSKRKRS